MIQKDISITQKDTFIKQKETSITQKATFIKQKDTSITQNDTFIKENDTSITRKDSLLQNVLISHPQQHQDVAGLANVFSYAYGKKNSPNNHVVPTPFN
jgi:uncharacterized protein (DUF3084 family)